MKDQATARPEKVLAKVWDSVELCWRETWIAAPAPGNWPGGLDSGPMGGSSRTVAVSPDEVDYLENGQLIARLSNARKISPVHLAQYEREWIDLGRWPLAASHMGSK